MLDVVMVDGAGERYRRYEVENTEKEEQRKREC